MRILAIDTATEMCSVSLSVSGEVRSREVLAANRHSSMVLGMVDELLAEAALTLNQLDLLVNDIGPGSFTGIRIGLGVAQGLAYGADLPLLGVDALTTLAKGAGNLDDDVLAMIDARMGQIYWGHFACQAGFPVLQGALHMSEPQGLTGLDRPVHVVGSGWDTYADSLSDYLTIEAFTAQRFPLAAHGLALAVKEPESSWVSAGELRPVYLRDDVAKVSRKPGLLLK